MAQKTNDNITGEVEKRLEDLFMEEEEVDFDQDSGDFENSPLKDLKATVLSIDWEIDDEIMTTLLKQAEALKETYKDDKVMLLFLKLLSTLGRYIRTNKSQSHPDALKVLNSVYHTMEKMVRRKDMSLKEKKEIIQVEVERFKKLKDQIFKPKQVADLDESDRLSESEEQLELPEVSKPEPILATSPHEAFAYAVDEIKQMIKAEFQALRAELKLWREGS